LLNPLVTDTGTIAARTPVSSYFFALNALPGAIVDTSVTFSSPVLGLIYLDGSNPYGPNPSPLNPNFANSTSNFYVGGHDAPVGEPKPTGAAPRVEPLGEARQG